MDVDHAVFEIGRNRARTSRKPPITTHCGLRCAAGVEDGLAVSLVGVRTSCVRRPAWECRPSRRSCSPPAAGLLEIDQHDFARRAVPAAIFSSRLRQRRAAAGDEHGESQRLRWMACSSLTLDTTFT